MTLYSSDNVGTVGNKIEINNNVGDGGDFLGDGGLCIFKAFLLATVFLHLKQE